MSSPRHPPHLRPYRLAAYALFFVAAGWLVFALAHGIWSELYRSRGPTGPMGVATTRTCTDELEALYRRLTSHSGGSVSSGSDRARFTADFEERLARFEQRCVEAAPADASPEVRAALATGADRLDDLRLHLSRCGEEGDREAAAVAAVLATLRERSLTGPR